MDAITITIPGQPVAQPRPKISTMGGRGRAYVEKKHPIHAYREAVVLSAIAAARRARHVVTECPVVLVIEAVFERPPSHLGKNGTPLPSARTFPPRSDWDNLGKGVSDAITDSGVIWKDDEQVVDGRVRKRYSIGPKDPARTVVVVREDDGTT